MKPNIYIIIVTYNGMLWLRECLDNTIGYNVIVVDNNSKDETVEFIDINYPSVKLFKQDENLGFGKANNFGISKALKSGADGVFLLNQDAYLSENTIENLYELQLKNPDFGILSPIHINGEGDKLDLNFSKYLISGQNNQFYSDYVINRNIKPIYQVDFVNAAGWLISKDCLEKIGGFDPIFFHYGEDENYCQRVLFHGFKIGIVPGCFMKHDREYREAPKKKASAEQEFKDTERFLKKTHANINIPYNGEIASMAKRRKASHLKSLLKFKIRLAKLYLNKYAFCKKIHTEVIESRKTNEKTGPNYLNVN